jgi:5-methylcytosine-specific restriction enzyme B
MAIRPGTEPILEAAAAWKTECLLSDGSMITDKRLWTKEHLDELDRWYVQRPDLGKGRFLEKLKEQLSQASDEAKLLTAELLWVIYLFPTNIGGKRKIENIRTVWAWSDEPFPDDHSMIVLLRENRGIGSGGPGFLTHMWAELSFLITMVQAWKNRPRKEKERLLNDPWAFAESLEEFPEKGFRQLRHILRYLIFPEVFEHISSGRDKKAIVAAYTEEAGEVEEKGLPALLPDRKLLAIRRTLEDRYPDETVDFYKGRVRERWRPKEPPIEPPDLKPEKLEEFRRAFLEYYPDFESFQDPPPSYAEDERGYKDELVEEFARRFAAPPDPSDLDSRLSARLVEDVLEVLTRRLSHSDGPQNLLNWRYFDFLRHLKPEEKEIFAKAFLDLLSGEGSSPNRVERFNKAIWPLLERAESATPAISRSFPTLFLMLHDPESEIFIRTDLMNGTFKALKGGTLFEGKPLDAGEYRKALGFAEAIRNQLADWKWSPQDMIDVHTFLWVANHSYSRKGGGVGPDDPIPDVEPPPPIDGDFSALVMNLSQAGLYFPEELVANYVIALQTKRFVILTGISGTGKTKLAQQVARMLGAESQGEQEDRYELIAVRPDWTDNRGLLGYYNPLAKTYVPTSFLLLLLRARQEAVEAEQEGRSARPFFVVLDEMNLARVEHYFSDFLSALESEEGLELHHYGRVEVEAEGELWTIPARLKVPDNIFFTGTVNLDETTYMFSPKVLDRAFTLELNEVDLKRFGADASSAPRPRGGLILDRIPVPLRMERRPGEDDWRWLGEGLEEGRLRSAIEDLNELLTGSGRHFGYRVATEIARFVRLSEKQSADGASAAWPALDLAVLQKVLPKFHGTQQEIQEPLRKVFAFAVHGDLEKARTNAEDPVQAWTWEDGALVSTTQDGSSQAPVLPRTAEKTWRMLRQLPARGFTSFIE